MEGKKSFILYSDILDIIEELSDEQSGVLFKTILRYVNDMNPELPKDKILKRLENIESTIYRTDKDGTIQLVSDGKTNEIIKIDVNFDGSQIKN